MSSALDVAPANFAQWQEETERACESPSGCDDPAVALVLVKHHRHHPCGSTVYRCKAHLDGLVEQCRHMLTTFFNRGNTLRCSKCYGVRYFRTLDDLIRVIPL